MSEGGSVEGAGGEIKAAKAALRRETMARVRSLTAAQKEACSAALRERLRVQRVWTEGRRALFFAPLPIEPDVWPLLVEWLAAGKEAALPRFNRESGRYEICAIRSLEAEVAAGYYGIREPVPGCSLAGWKQLDLILVPGVAFDLLGRRLGRGKGYYDQLLQTVEGMACGVAFDEQIVASVPVTRHDRSMNCILTPARWVTPPRRPDLE
jgi:5-formyltetrahydrofolate cyclo-ligase